MLYRILNYGDNLSSILVVDDEPMARSLIRLMLVREGFDVSEAANGIDALRKLDQFTPDIMILDVMMPGLDGITMCKQIRNRTKTAALPIIMLSARTDMESINEGINAGATRYLKKPISAAELTEHVREILIKES